MTTMAKRPAEDLVRVTEDGKEFVYVYDEDLINLFRQDGNIAPLFIPLYDENGVFLGVYAVKDIKRMMVV